MGKIKGWEKYTNRPEYIRYSSVVGGTKNALSKSPNWLILTINGFKYKKYGWNVSIMESDSYPHINLNFKTKKQALDYSVEFMRSHPNG